MFKFNFSADDLEFDDPSLASEDQDVDQLTQPLSTLSVSGSTTATTGDSKTSQPSCPETPVVPASQLDLLSKSSLRALPSTLHYELAQIPLIHPGSGVATAIATDLKTGHQKEVITLYKRNLEDVKFQIAQDDDEFDDNSDSQCKGQKSGPGGVEMLALAGTSDLVKGVYEGGLKTWECALDLVAYLAEQKNNYEGKKVLELGCGSALPGIYVLTQSDSVQVDFQDYNDQVLKLVTLPNVLLNSYIRPDQQPPAQEIEDESEDEDEKKEKNEGEDEDEDEEDDDDDEPEADPADGDFQGVEIDLPASEEDRRSLLTRVQKQSRFFMGDWGGLVDLMAFNDETEKYDLILTSETIYAEESHPKLYATIKNSLKRDGGRALVAAKTFYFGVGGDILSFRQLIEKDGVFDVKVVFSAQAFVRREILELTFKK